MIKVVDSMKKFIVNNIMSYIKKNTDYNDIKLKEIEYGIISIYLTFSKLIIIISLALILGIFKEVIIFLILFNILRSTGFGLHATKSWICLLSSTLIFIGFPLLSKNININIYIKIIICILSVILMFKNIKSLLIFPSTNTKLNHIKYISRPALESILTCMARKIFI